MSQEKKTETTNKEATAKKVMVIGLVIFMAIIALMLYFKEGASRQAFISQVKQDKVISVEELDREYKSEYKKIIGDYLNASSNSSADLLSKTREAQDKILALKTSINFKEFHLQAVLSLSAIEGNIVKNDPKAINDNLEKLTQSLATIN